MSSNSRQPAHGRTTRRNQVEKPSLHYPVKSSRVGPAFQCTKLPALRMAMAQEREEIRSQLIEGIGVWNPRILHESIVLLYIQVVKGLFSCSDIRLFSLEKVLFFLHSHRYDVQAALSLLFPNREILEQLIAGIPNERTFYDSKISEVIPAPPKISRQRLSATAGPAVQLEDEDEFCFQCKEGGDLILCDNPICSKVYHFECLKISKLPEGAWECPQHSCSICKTNPAPKQFQCINCSNSYCIEHCPRHLQRDYAVPMFLCENCCSFISQGHDHMFSDLVTGSTARRQFMRHLKSFYEKNTGNKFRAPVIKNEPLDLYSLYKYVLGLGGWTVICKKSLWYIVARLMGIPNDIRNSGHLLQSHYFYFLHSYEKEFSHVSRVSGIIAASESTISKARGRNSYSKKRRRSMNLNLENHPPEEVKSSQENISKVVHDNAIETLVVQDLGDKLKVRVTINGVPRFGFIDKNFSISTN